MNVRESSMRPLDAAGELAVLGLAGPSIFLPPWNGMDDAAVALRASSWKANLSS